MESIFHINLIQLKKIILYCFLSHFLHRLACLKRVRFIFKMKMHHISVAEMFLKILQSIRVVIM